jgi:hypothetical protein
MRGVVIIVGLFALVLGCKEPTKTFKFTDTQGRAFTADCPGGYGKTKQYDCTYSVKSTVAANPSGAAPPGAQPGFSLSSGSRYSSVCQGWLTNDEQKHVKSFVGGQCRLITCTSDADCPPGSQLTSPSCINGLCGELSHPMDFHDVDLLCGADTPQQEIALQLPCGPDGKGPCTIPAGCRQP